MAVTYSSALLGANTSALRNALISVAGGAVETITLAHQLGACPTEVRFALRSITTLASYMPSQFIVTALNASQATIVYGTVGNFATVLNADIICENQHSLTR